MKNTVTNGSKIQPGMINTIKFILIVFLDFLN